MIKAYAKMDLERFGRVIFKKGNKYQFRKKMTTEGMEYYSIMTVTGEVDFSDRDLTKFFVIDNSVEETEEKKEG